MAAQPSFSLTLKMLTPTGRMRHFLLRMRHFPPTPTYRLSIPMLLLALMLPILTGCPRRPAVQGVGPGALAFLAPGPEVPTRPTLLGGTDAPSPKGAKEGIPEVIPLQSPEALREEVILLQPSEALKEAAVTPEEPVPAEAPLADIFFAFDQALIQEEMRQVLDKNVEWLKAHPGVRITIEGHCDERGTSEYNLALGQRRARATWEYLVAAGIDPGRLTILSYGEERPFVLGHDESAWKWNRRAHFVVTAP